MHIPKCKRIVATWFLRCHTIAAWQIGRFWRKYHTTWSFCQALVFWPYSQCAQNVMSQFRELGIAWNVRGIKTFFYICTSVKVMWKWLFALSCKTVQVCALISIYGCVLSIHLYKPFWTCNEPDDLQMDMDWSSRLMAWVSNAWMYHVWIKAIQFSTVGITLTGVKAEALWNDWKPLDAKI